MPLDGQKVTTFKERLCDLCAESGANDATIARMLGVSKQTLSAWKCGSRSPKQLTVITIAQRFGVNVDWIMGFNTKKYTGVEDSQEDYLFNALLKYAHMERTEDMSSDKVQKVMSQMLKYFVFLLTQEM